jgi:uncharacterized protein (DUF2252 family)
MSTIANIIQATPAAERQAFIVKSFTDNYADLIAGDPSAWRGKFRKMAESAFAFYRGSAALFYADVSRDEDPFLNEQTGRVWIQGDLHASNFGTYMNGAGIYVFDVNDFDEATVAPFTWDVKRLCASLALIGFQKALSDIEIRDIIAATARGYAEQVAHFATTNDHKFALTLATTEGPVLNILKQARELTRVALLDNDTNIVDGERCFKRNKGAFEMTEVEKKKIEGALAEYFDTIPARKKKSKITYTVKDMVRRKGLGIGSAGLKIFSILIEGETEALENDIVIGMKVAQPSAAAKYVNDPKVAAYFKHEGHRTAISQRALQAYADPFLGYSSLEGEGMFVQEISPYVADLDWNDINDMDDILQMVENLGRCVAKIHCVSDDDSDQTLITYSTEAAINGVLDGRESEFVAYMVNFGENYANCVRNDYRLFVDAFRNKMIPGV